MSYINLKPKNKSEQKLFTRINVCFKNIFNKLKSVELSNIGISDYNRRYINEYLIDYTFYSQFYSQVLISALRNLSKPIEESVFVDYGGGSGFFSFIASELGFKTIIYNDIYDVSVTDAKILSLASGFKINHFISGDISELVTSLNQLNIEVDLVCSFEVIEHIYNLDQWFSAARKLPGQYVLVCSSSANIKNPYIKNRLKKAQIKAELKGTVFTKGSKKRDSIRPFFEIRKEIISNLNLNLSFQQVDYFAKLTRGFDKTDIENGVTEFADSGKTITPINHPTNTCDPLTGNWSEHLINFNWLKQTAEKNGFSNTKIKPGLYTYSNKKITFAIKQTFNFLIRKFPFWGLFISPIYILITKK